MQVYTSTESIHTYIAHFSIKSPLIRVLMQGKLFQRCAHLLYCTVLSLGGNVNTRRMSKPDMGSIFPIKKYSGHRKLLFEFSKLSKFNAINLLGYLINTDESILVYKFCPEKWFQYVRRVYETAINFPCIITLIPN